MLYRFRDKGVIQHALALRLLALVLLFSPLGAVLAQQPVVFQVNGKNYRADVFWTVKHHGVEFRGATMHNLNRSDDSAFDLAVYFKFRDDSIPADENILWGFRFNQNGGIISPSNNEKRSRSLHLFQRFELSGGGNAGLTIIPVVWRRTASGQLEVIAQAQPAVLGFAIADVAPKPTVATAPELTAPQRPVEKIPERKPEPPLTPLPDAIPEDESTAFTAAAAVRDSTQKIKALMEFVDKFAAAKPKSDLVGKAIKDIPLGTSLPVAKEKGQISYTLNYAVNPVVDTSSVKGWDWELTPAEFGRFKLTLSDLGDTVHAIRIADIGKNAPFNRPRELRPFDKIRVTLAGEDRDSFQIRLEGGTPPFIVFLSDKRVPRERYVLDRTDTIWSISKSSCRLCKTGAHTLEVYDSDFSTLLLRAESAIHIYRVNYVYAALFGVAAVLILFFAYKPLLNAWRRFLYLRKLRQIEAWEKRDAEGKSDY